MSDNVDLTRDRAANFTVGQVISHKLFGYRGVIIDVDPEFLGSEEWYERVAQTNPPKDRPWYHILVHETGRRTYVAERNLLGDRSGDPVEHPFVPFLFTGFDDGLYQTRIVMN